MTSLFTSSPDELEELQHLFLTYVNKDFENCTCGCRGFPINILTIEFNEREIDLQAYKNCPARNERKTLQGYKEFQEDEVYKKFLIDIYPERYENRDYSNYVNNGRPKQPPSKKQILKAQRHHERNLNWQRSKEASAKKQILKAKKQQEQHLNWYRREEAKKRGQKTFQGYPCLNGHKGLRDVRDNSCVECHQFRRSMRNAITRGAFRERLNRSDKLEISAIYAKCRAKTKETGIEHHVDHVKPLAAGGRHHPSNLKILTAQENLQKGATYKRKTHFFSKKEKAEYKAMQEKRKTTQVSSGRGIWGRIFGG